MKITGIAGNVEPKVSPERLALPALVINAKSRDTLAVIVPNFKSSDAKIAKSKATELATSAFA